MTNVNRNYDDFAKKICQSSTLDNLKKYVIWQRDVRSGGGINNIKKYNEFPGSLISINLDITVACNYSCRHCVDLKILNTGNKLSLDEISKSIQTLTANGLKSIILIGGGEPLLHPNFESIVRLIKSNDLQLGIVTNGSITKKLFNIVKYLKEKDWIRFSLDAGNDRTFNLIHRPKKAIRLNDICSTASKIKELNPEVSLGFSYIIFYTGGKVRGIQFIDNIDEMPLAVDLAVKNNFDYITFKPCLIKTDETLNRETLLFKEERDKVAQINNKIKVKLKEAKELAGDRIKLIESINLRAMLNDELAQYKNQPKNCHKQILNQIITPIGIYHCPAYRGDLKALVASKEGYISQEKYRATLDRSLEVMLKFDASQECKDIVCFYNRLNWWIEDVINKGEELTINLSEENGNYFI